MRHRLPPWLRPAAATVSALTDLLLPPRCAACDALLSDATAAFCAPCATSAMAPPDPCSRCGEPGCATHCPRCAAQPPPFVTARARLLHGGQAAVAIRRFKYARRTDLARPLGRLLAETAPPEADLACPVPLHRRALARRGFNPPALLAARALARRLPITARALLRTRDTPPQASLPRRAREANVAGAFAARSRLVSGRSLLLVDDVMTTGATARACADALLNAGAREVHVLTLARAAVL